MMRIVRVDELFWISEEEVLTQLWLPLHGEVVILASTTQSVHDPPVALQTHTVPIVQLTLTTEATP